MNELDFIKIFQDLQRYGNLNISFSCVGDAAMMEVEYTVKSLVSGCTTYKHTASKIGNDLKIKFDEIVEGVEE